MNMNGYDDSSEDSKAEQLRPTIQTMVGMVMYNGKARDRKLPHLDKKDYLNREYSKVQKVIVLPQSMINYDRYGGRQNEIPRKECIEMFYNCVISKIFPVNSTFVEKQKEQSQKNKKNKKNKKKKKNENIKEAKQINELIEEMGGFPLKNMRMYEKNGKKSQIQRLFGNIYACTRDELTLWDLQKYINSAKRIDTEQAVAMIISLLRREKQFSTIRKSLMMQLITECSQIIFTSCMWLQTDKDDTHGLNANELQFAMFANKFDFCLNMNNNNNNNNNKNKYERIDGVILMNKLRSIRCSKKRNKNRRCLRIPDMFYLYADMQRPKEDEYRYDLATSSWPMREVLDEKEGIYVSKRMFNRMNRKMQRMQAIEWSFRKRIWKLKNEIACLNVNAVNNTNDVISLCFAFLSFIRHSQLKIVSSINSHFLKKGQSSHFMQNTPNKLSSFEQVLVKTALGNANKNVLDLPVLTAIITPAAVINPLYSNNDNIKWQRCAVNIDKCSLLMEEYIITYGNGRFDNLCYQDRKRGGARGPVDDYNLLVDILRKFVKRFQEAVQFERNNGKKSRNKKNATKYGYSYLSLHLPVTNHKFLAKDILHHNKAWNDDAFANGKRPDWLKWLQFRRKQGVVAPATQILW